MSLKLHKSYSNKFNYKSNYDNYNFKITNSRNQEFKNNDDIIKNSINLPNSPRTNKYNKHLTIFNQYATMVSGFFLININLQTFQF